MTVRYEDYSQTRCDRVVRAAARGGRVAAGGAARREQTVRARGERHDARARDGRLARRQGAARACPQEAQGTRDD